MYGHEVRVEFVRRIRDEVKFDGKEALLKQLNLDRERCRALLRGLP
ncbi:MAG: riboflavin kinase [Rhodothermales bacterium]